MKEPLRPHTLIASYLAREVHCGSSALSAVRQCLAGSLFGGRDIFFASHDRTHRRFAIASIMLQHARNKIEYHNVMEGPCRPWRTVHNPYAFDTATKQITIT